MIGLKRAFLPMVLFGFGGCATVVRGPNVDFAVVTEPAGASVTTDLLLPEVRRAENRQEELVRLGFIDTAAPVEPAYHGCAPTPCEMKLPRRSKFEVAVTREGYHPAIVSISSGFGRGGATGGAAGAAATATGAYVVTYGAYVAFASTVTTLVTLGATTTATAGASAAATTAAAGVGVLFLGVDVASGAMMDLQPNPLILVLVPDTDPHPGEGLDLLDTPDAVEAVLEAQRG